MTEQPVLANYDPLADVLYLSVGEADRRTLSFEDDDGLIWRQSPEGDCRGVTIRDFKYFWMSRETELAQRIAVNLHVPKAMLRDQIHEFA